MAFQTRTMQRGGERVLVTSQIKYASLLARGWTVVPNELPGGLPFDPGGGGGSSVIETLPPSNGTDDTAALNAVLAGAKGKRVRGVPGQTYLISAPLVLPAGGNVELDMTGCTVHLKDTVVQNLVKNAATTALRTGAGSTTAGSTTLTASGFTADDVGRFVKIPGAAVSGDLLVARVVAVSGTTVTLDTAASTAVTGATVAVHAIDYDITLIGGTWDHGTARTSGGNSNDHSMVFRFCERLTVRDMHHVSAWGKYGISLAGVKNATIERHRFATYSDGVHVAGPSEAIFVSDLSGRTDDDMFAITSAEPQYWYDLYGDCIGYVRNVVAQNIHKDFGLARIAHVVYGRSAPVENVTIRNVSGASEQSPVFIWSDTDRPGGRLDNLLIEGVSARSTTNTQHVVSIQAVTGNKVTVRDVHRDAFGGYAGHGVHILNSAIETVNLENIDIRNRDFAGGLLALHGSTSIETLRLRGVYHDAQGAGFAHTVRMTDSATVAQFIFADAWLNFNGSDCYGLALTDSASIGHCTIRGVRAKAAWNTGGVVQTLGSATLPRLELAGFTIETFYWLADLNSVTTVVVSAVTAIGNVGSFHMGPAAQVTVIGSGFQLAGRNVGSDGGWIRINALGFPINADQSTAQAGDILTNINAGLACGTGPVGYTGTAWKHLITGATT